MAHSLNIRFRDYCFAILGYIPARPLLDKLQDLDVLLKYHLNFYFHFWCEFLSSPNMCTITAQTDIPGNTKTTVLSPAAPFYRIQIFTQSDLLKQPFLSELREVINASYRDPGIVPFEEIGTRLKSDTQLIDELEGSGFTAIAFVENAIVGTASMKQWMPYSEGSIWKPTGHFDPFSADEIFSGGIAVLNSLGESQQTICEGDYELAAVAIKPDPQYRRKGIAENLVKACEDELKRRILLGNSATLPRVRIMLKVVREIKGPYWLKKGFRIVGEQYCPPLTWDFKKGFVLWAMERELTLD